MFALTRNEALYHQLLTPKNTRIHPCVDSLSSSIQYTTNAAFLYKICYIFPQKRSTSLTYKTDHFLSQELHYAFKISNEAFRVLVSIIIQQSMLHRPSLRRQVSYNHCYVHRQVIKEHLSPTIGVVACASRQRGFQSNFSPLSNDLAKRSTLKCFVAIMRMSI